MSSLELIQTLVEAGFPEGTRLSPLDFDWLWQTEASPFLKWFCMLDSRYVLSDTELQELASLDGKLQNGQSDNEVLNSMEEESSQIQELERELAALNQETEQLRIYEETLLGQDEEYSRQSERLEEESKQMSTALKHIHREEKMEREQALQSGERLDKSLNSLLTCCKAASNQTWVCLDGARQRAYEAHLLSSMLEAKVPPYNLKIPTQVENEFEAIENRVQDTEGFHLKSTLEFEALQKVLKFYEALLQHPDLSTLLASHRLSLEMEQAKTSAHYSAQRLQKVWETEVHKSFQLSGQVARTQLDLAQNKGQNNRLKKALLDWTHMMLNQAFSQAARLQLLFLGHNMEWRSLRAVQTTIASVSSLVEPNQVKTEVDSANQPGLLQDSATQLIEREDRLAQFLVSILGNKSLREALFNTYPDLVAVVQQAQLQRSKHKSAFQAGLKSLATNVAVLEKLCKEALNISRHDQAHNYLATLTSLQQDYDLLQAQIRSLVKDLEMKKKDLAEDKLRELERQLYVQFYTSPNKFTSTFKHLLSQAENERQLINAFSN